MNKNTLLLTTLIIFFSSANSQTLPLQWTLDEDNHRLIIGDVQHTGLYDENTIRDVYLSFDQNNFEQLLEDNYSDAIAIPATITVDGVEYPEVGARYKGQTSYFMNESDKKSFNITMDEYDSSQDLMGYESLNFTCGYFDPTWMREFIFQRIIRKHIPAAASNYINLYINGEDWGIYTNVQQTNAEFLEEWFLDNSGVRWRADAPEGSGGPGGGGPGGGGPGGGGPGGGGPGGGGPGGGPQWGDGTAALNYLGPDTTEYQEYYTLKSSNIDNPWDVLVHTCDVLENTSLDNLYSELNQIMDVDRTLWFLAAENVFADDDGYIHKGKMDYHVFYEEETGQMVPLEYDGNTVLMENHQSWSPFYNANDENYPLLYKLLQIPELRQRYLAHMRVILEDLDPTNIEPLIEYWSNFIDEKVQNDPHAIYPYSQFTFETDQLLDVIAFRHNHLSNAPEVNVTIPSINSVEMESSQGVWASPLPEFGATITATSSDNLDQMNLYFSTEANGQFTKVDMDANGGEYSAFIPAQSIGTLVRFYLEAVSSNDANTRSYSPSGAEHDTYYYTVDPPHVKSPQIAINEIMSVNSTSVQDEAGEFDDWIELYNLSGSNVDLGGWHLSDNPWNLDKWEIPAGTVIGPDGYLIFWADEDGSQGDLHSNFKLSGSGESLYLTSPEEWVVDMLDFPASEDDLGYARVPNGTGDFVFQAPTFSSNNEEHSLVENLETTDALLYPNPATSELNLVLGEIPQQAILSLVSTSGQVVISRVITSDKTTIDVEKLISGIYLVVVNTGDGISTKRVVIQ
ncbi:MAG: hypothetical protein CL847_05120 [Crocinitomicaceae bacterium]|nr:hypothetical protein [Crocinitomicaceae bacterium]